MIYGTLMFVPRLWSAVHRAAGQPDVPRLPQPVPLQRLLQLGPTGAQQQEPTTLWLLELAASQRPCCVSEGPEG